MIAKRLKQLRLARGLSLDALATEMGGIVTKQAISKYESGASVPSPTVLRALARVFDVKSAHLWEEPIVSVEFPGYRKKSRLTKRESGRLESIIEREMEQRVRLQELVGSPACTLPVQKYPVSSLEDAELAAEQLRKQWSLGLDPIAHLTHTLEAQCVHVVEVDAADSFDGISAIARDDRGRMKAVGAVTRRSVSGERQRFNIAHEVGHLTLDIASDLDVEKCAHRFGGAFLAPADSVRRDIGERRTYLVLEELHFLRARYGLSLQASLRRLLDLEIITQATYKSWCINFSKWGWRTSEPDESDPEQPQWFRRTVLRAVAEGMMAAEEGGRMLNSVISDSAPPSLIEKRAFMRLSIEERRRLLKEQAEKMRQHYGNLSDSDAIQGGDIEEH